MNKKFSTLLAGAALLSAVSANAAVDPDIKLVAGQNSGLYQLSVLDAEGNPTDQVLNLEENSLGEDVFSVVSTTTNYSTKLGSSLWCVEIVSEDQGQNPKFDFTNKQGKFLGLDINTLAGKGEGDAVNAVAGGDLSGWKFSKVFENGVEESMLYSYFTSDSVIALNVKGNVVKMVKYAANEVEAQNLTKFKLTKADEVTINTKNDFNTIFGTQKKDDGVKLTFNKDVLGEGVTNYFTENKIMVEESGDPGYMYVLNMDSSYLYVDTAYTNEIGGAKFLDYNWADLRHSKLGSYEKATDSIAATALNDQYKFKFIYSPSNDSLIIKVKKVTLKENVSGEELDFWNDVAAVIKTDWNVSLQELQKDKVRILTVAKEQNTKISFGFAGCAPVTTTKTTIADGVYLIRDAKTGKYLASPIYDNGRAVEWVTLDLQEAKHMPAYQWVVLKKNSVDKNNVSPVEAINREFDYDATVNIATMQLNKKPGAKYMYVSNVTSNRAITSADSLEFIPVEKEIYTDKYVGYLNLTEDELITNKYTFNYWHPYADDKFISLKDSTMSVLEGKTAFRLKSSYKEHAYGYKPTDEVAGNADKKITGRIPGLVQPVRKMYIITDGNKVFRNCNNAIENNYKLSKFENGNYNSYGTQNDSVYFKENNHIDGKHYYAIVEATSTGLISHHKAGVSDYDAAAMLKVQPLSETRTSSFAIAPDNTPLYRHFNNAALGENADDSCDSLVFVEKTRGEYLMDEWNENLRDEEVCYAGIWNAEKANGHLAFNIDTAWVNRGSGLVKPQYLISVARNDQSSIETIPCTEDGPHVRPDGTITTDPSECVHAIHGREGFIYGKFLVSFADSVANLTDKDATYDVPYMDVKNGYTRVGFVPAIKIGDSLVVLTDEFKKVAPEKLDTATIFASYRANKQENFIVDLTGDNHKNVTWSFRYVNPDQAGNVAEEGVANEFLFESNIYTKNGKVVSDSNVATGNGKAALGYDEVVAGSIAPAYAAWLKMQNGCLVLTDATSSFGNAKTGGDGALIFNAYQKAADQDMVTDNEEIAVEEGVSVIAGNGVVTIQGAAGKTVVITNILGKAVANTVLTSDNQTINVPAGIVAVAVEGEEAVKAIVR